MKIPEVIPRDSRFEDNVHGANIIDTWDVIHQVFSVFQNHWPQFGSHSLGPSKFGMKHHCSGKAEEDTNLPFGHCILVVSTNSTESDTLLHVGQLIHEFSCSEDTIVSVVVDDSDAHGSHLPFIVFLGLDGLSSSEVDNGFNKDMF